MTNAYELSHSRAATALRAAKNRQRWGAYATIRYVILHNCPLDLYFLAAGLEKSKGEQNDN